MNNQKPQKNFQHIWSKIRSFVGSIPLILQSHKHDTMAIVPKASVAGNTLTLLLIVMSFLACLTFGAVVTIRNSANDWQRDIGREITVQIQSVEGANIDDEVEKALDILDKTEGVGAFYAMSDAQSRSLLEPWLGQGAQDADLPVPRLIVIPIENAQVFNYLALNDALQNGVKGVKIDDHRVWQQHLRSMSNAMVGAGIFVLFLVFSAAVLSVSFATRGAINSNKTVVDVLHFVGASDSFVANEFQRHFLGLGFRGGMIGGILASFTFYSLSSLLNFILFQPEGQQLDFLFGDLDLGITGYIGIFGVVILFAVLTATISRFTVYRYLSEIA